jgi:hypothetical protein
MEKTQAPTRLTLLAALSFLSCRIGFASPLPSAQPPTLIPPVASEPAAGICGGPDSSDLAIVRVNVDVPDPRCLQVRPDQGLRVINHTDTEISVRLGPHQVLIQPGGEGDLPEPFGNYLAPGVHRLEVDPYGGPEIIVLPAGL